MNFETRVEFFFPAGEKLQDEGGGRVLLGDNAGGLAIMLQPIKFQCAGAVWISSGRPGMYMCS